VTYLNIDEVDTAVINLSVAYPGLTQLITLPHQTVENRTSHALRIGGGAAGSRDVIMAIGGQHAREWGSCEILINFAADLLEAYQSNAGLAYGGKTFSAGQVQGILDGLHVVVFPLVNPDGRLFSQTVDSEGGSQGWRRNRNPAQSGGNPQCIGVDLNRNYDILFDFKNKFDPFAYSPQNPKPLVVSDDPCDFNQTYHGPSAFSEAETENVRWLIDAFPRTRWFFDVHSYGEWILYNWGDDENQSNNPDMNFRNPTYDSARGIGGDADYKEYIPSGDELIEATLADRMADAIQAVRGKQYQPVPSFVGLYPTSGTSKDYAYSRHHADPSKGKVFSYTIEWGEEFRPQWQEMELIIQDVTAGLIEACVQAPCVAGLVAVSLDTPSLQFIDVPAGEEAVRAVVFTVETCTAVTFTAQQPAENPAGPATLGLPFGNVESLPAVSTSSPREVRIWVSYQAPNPNNVATGSVTIHCDPLNQDFVVPISANTIPPPKVASVLVLDRSASMAWASGIPGKNRIDVLHDAAPVYPQLLPDDHSIGVVAFDHDPYAVKPVLQADAGGRDEAIDGINNHQPNPTGNTAIGDGVELAHATLQPLAGFDAKAMVVFTDGHETAAKYIADVENLIDERVFALGLGTAQQLNPVALNSLVNNSEGYLLLTGDLTGDDEIRVEKYFSQIQAGVSNEEVVVDPEGRLKPGDKHRIPFVITECDRSASVFLLSPAPWAIDFALETPNGELIDPAAAAALPAIDFVMGSRVHQYRMSFPVPVGGGARQGLWHAILSVPRQIPKTFGSGDRLARAVSAPVHGLLYGLNVHAASGLRLDVRISQNSNEPGAVLTPRAVLTESGVPVEKRASVRAEVHRPDGLSTTLQMPEVEPGVFEAKTVAQTPGIYPIRLRAAGMTRRGSRFSREQVRTAAVWHGGDRPPPSSTTQPPAFDWCKFLDCLLHQEGVVEWLKRLKVDAAQLRRCLEVLCRDVEYRPQLPIGELAVVERIVPLLENAIRSRRPG
jgi:murein tripeptide amidase MpaA